MGTMRNHLIALAECGEVDRDRMIVDLLKFMSEDDCELFAKAAGYTPEKIPVVAVDVERVIALFQDSIAKLQNGKGCDAAGVIGAGIAMLHADSIKEVSSDPEFRDSIADASDAVTAWLGAMDNKAKAEEFDSITDGVVADYLTFTTRLNYRT